MTDSSIASLVYVVQQGGARLEDLGRQLETAEPRRVEPILRAIQAEGDGLSAALTRLSHHADALPDDEPERIGGIPCNDPRLLDIVRMLRAACHGFVCPRCGGALRHASNHGCFKAPPSGSTEIEPTTPPLYLS